MIKIMECLTKKFGQFRLEKMEEWLDNWMEFREGDFDEEDDFFFAMKEIGIRKNDLKITDQEMMRSWMLKTVRNKRE